MKEFSYIITHREGLHARPAGMLVKTALQFQSSVFLKKGQRSGDAKRVFAVMGLGAAKDDKIIVTVEGPDEEIAAKALWEFLKENL